MAPPIINNKNSDYKPYSNRSMRVKIQMVLKKGTRILKSEPYAYVLCTEFRGLYCDFCFKKAEKLHKCTQCLFSFFCNKKCQKLGWKDHKQECLNLKRVRPIQPTDFVRLTARIIYKFKTQPEIYVEIGKLKRGFQDLMSHVESIKNDPLRVTQYNTIRKLITDFITPDSMPTNDELFEIFGKITINSYSICDIEMQPIGVGLYLDASIFNHSCQPNATIVFEGPKLYVNAVEDIPEFSPSKVFVPYVDLLASTDERRRDLKSQYYFDCMCNRCTDQEQDSLSNSILCPNEKCSQPTVIKKNKYICIQCGEVNLEENKFQEIQRLVENCKQVYEEMKQLQKVNNYQEINDKAENCIEKAKTVLHVFNVNYVRILDFSFDACINLSKWETACELGKEILSSYKHHYGNFHPNLGVHVMKVGKILLYLENLPESESTLREAASIISVTHTRDHHLYSICRDLLSQCEMELKFHQTTI